jgi:hypothetical protein
MLGDFAGDPVLQVKPMSIGTLARDLL